MTTLRVLGFFAVTQTALIASAFANPDVIIRLREPQNTHADTLSAIQSLSSKGTIGVKAQILNGEEGVVKLSFQDATRGREVMTALAASGEILNIAPNLRYRPAISYRPRAVVPANESERLFAMPLLPFASPLAASTFPEVQLPPAQKSGEDPLVTQDWALGNIRLGEVKDSMVTTSIITAVIDTGIDYNHEDLTSGLWRKPGNPREVGYDFAHNVARPYDVLHFDVDGCLNNALCSIGIGTDKFLVNPGHGTHCAGHVAAVAKNALGMRGIGAGARIMGLKFFKDFGEEGAGGGDDAAAIQSIDYAIKNGAKVISASWGGRTPRDEAEKSELKQALVRARNAGVLVVIAAGNDGIDQDSVDDPDYPAAFELDNMIVVAATDKNDALADFSNYGGRTVHIGAPGVKILSTTVGSKYSDTVARFKGKDGTEQTMDWDGTSMATPIVAGAATLLWSKYPKADYRWVRERILKTARRVPGLEGKVTTAGVLDVAAALKP